MERKAGWVELLEALYALELPQERWLSGVLRSAARQFVPDAGIAGVLYKLDRDDQLHVTDMQGVGVSPQWMRSGLEMHTTPQISRAISRGYRKFVCARSSDYMKAPQYAGELAREQMTRARIGESFLVNGLNPSGLGFSLYLFSRSHVRLNSEQRDFAHRIAVHLAAAYRLRHRLDAPSAAEPTIDAVLSTQGRIEHVEGDADLPPPQRTI